MPAVREWLKASSRLCAAAGGSLVPLGLAFGLVSCGGPTTPGGPVMDLHLSSDASNPGPTGALDSGAQGDSSTEDASSDDDGPGIPTDSGTSHDSGTPDGGSSAPGTTTAGVTLPAGWSLKISNRFWHGRGSHGEHALGASRQVLRGAVLQPRRQRPREIPTWSSTTSRRRTSTSRPSIAFASDHLTIQGRGQPDGSITSGEIVSICTARSFCIEANYRIPSTDKSWPAFWFYGDASGDDSRRSTSSSRSPPTRA